MSYAMIKDLSEKLSCEVVLASPDTPDSISGLLPLLKGIHTQCMAASLKTEAGLLIKAKNCISNILSNSAKNRENAFEELTTLISDFSSAVQDMEDTSADLDEPGSKPAVSRESATVYQGLSGELKELDKLIASFCPGEIPDLGALILKFSRIMDVSHSIVPKTFWQVSRLCKNYVEHMTLENMHKTKPVEEGLLLLKSILVYLRKDETFPFDYSEVEELLKTNLIDEQPSQGGDDAPAKDPVEHAGGRISDEDLEILHDFISEAEENLDAIEIHLIELEQDPSNTDTINDIFRPIHTIKGVSGFLSLTSINKLSHTTENLLDSARSGDFIIDQTVTDTILESVDMLKRLIKSLKTEIASGVTLPDDDTDVETLRETLKTLQVELTQKEKQPLGEILIKKRAADRQSVERALEKQKQTPEKKLGEILVEHEKVDPKKVASALMDQTHPRKKIDAQVKVSTRKLDDLVDFAGELVIAQSILKQKTRHEAGVSQSVSQLGQIVTNIQNLAMSMRMIPIKATFMKMIRLVRDLSRKSGKQADLNMFGEETEIDRNVVDALYEPMVHMIRNSVDHGIESREQRIASGKPEQGCINLRAYHKGGHIIIEIEDDGKGLDKDRIVEKALASGLISGKEQMTDSQIYDLIMAPGFSTAKKITDVSGRGVGMDVVKEGIEKFRGHLNIESRKGSGTKFTISLPLTLAIIDGMLVRVGDEKYIIPTISIQKAFKLTETEYFTVEGKGEMIKDRGNLIPLIRVDEIFNKQAKKNALENCLVVVVESKDEKRGLLIDELLGKDEYVIKNLGGGLEDIEGLAGGAILADGKVGLILDIHGIFTLASK